MPVLRANLAKVAFNGGEWSPQIIARSDVPKYTNGLRTCFNAVPRIQGGVSRRAPTRYVGVGRFHTERKRLVPFVFSAEDAFVLEFSAYHMRVWFAYGLVGSVDVETPYREEDLPDLQFQQSADVVYITHPRHWPRKLSRYSNTNWVMDALPVTGGPFLEQNTGSTTVYASAATGSVTLTASASLFTSDDIGTLFYAQVQDIGLVRPWEADRETFDVGDYCRADFRVYECTGKYGSSGSKTGLTTPTHTEGEAYDHAQGASGNSGRKWLFKSLHYGVLKITAVASGTSATATVLKTLPVNVVGSGNATKRWARGAWSEERGFPRCVTMYQDRLCLGGTSSRPDTIWLSATGDYENFDEVNASGEVGDDSAMELTLNAGQVNELRWLTADGNYLLGGTSGGINVIGPATTSEGFGPNNKQTSLQSIYGAAAIPPVKIGDMTVFVHRAKQRLYSTAYDFSFDKFVPRDLMTFSEHVLSSGAVALAHAQEPDNLLWVVRQDGQLAAMMMARAEDDSIGWGWHRHQISGYSDAAQTQPAVVEDICTIPAPGEKWDDVWMVVRRYINGEVRRYIEVMGRASPFQLADDEAWHVDSAVEYYGAATTSVSGLSHLEGQTVSAMADGEPVSGLTVKNGRVTLPKGASRIAVGLVYSSEIETLPMDGQGQFGTWQTMPKRVRKVCFRVYKSGGFKAGNDDGFVPIELRSTVDSMDEPVPLQSRILEVPWASSSEEEGGIRIVSDGVMPLNLLAIYPRVEVNEL